MSREHIVAPGRRGVWTATGVVLGVQLAGLIAYSTYLFSRFDLSQDFAHNTQAWFLIGHGTLAPVDTVRVPSTLFLRDHFDLILWPLSVLRLLSSSSLTLLVIQDLAIVATEVVTMMWVIRICEEFLDRWRLGAELAVLGVLVANAWWYETVSTDIHLPPLGLPLAVLTGYLLWCGRFRWALLPAASCVLFGAVVVELLAFIGFGALLTRRVRDQGGTISAAAITIGSVVWIFIVNGSGFNQASNITAEYSYLVGSAGPTGALGILQGVVAHPLTALRALGNRWHAVGRPLEMVGLLGLFTPSGASVAVGVLVPAALAASPVYSSSAGAFQTLAVVPFGLVGLVMVLAQFWARASRLGTRSRGRRVVLGLACFLVAVALIQDGRLLGQLRSTWWRVSPSASSALGTVLAHTPPGTEVIASNGIIGRFSERRFVYTLSFVPQTFPVEAKDVLFVVTPDQGNEAVPPAASRKDLSYIKTALNTRTLVDRDGVVALEWRPSRGIKTITLTGGSGANSTHHGASQGAG